MILLNKGKARNILKVISGLCAIELGLNNNNYYNTQMIESVVVCHKQLSQWSLALFPSLSLEHLRKPGYPEGSCNIIISTSRKPCPSSLQRYLWPFTEVCSGKRKAQIFSRSTGSWLWTLTVQNVSAIYLAGWGHMKAGLRRGSILSQSIYGSTIHSATASTFSAYGDGWISMFTACLPEGGLWGFAEISSAPKVWKTWSANESTY